MVKRREKIRKLEEAVADLTDKWKRALADYQNLEKRVSQEKGEFARYASAALIDKLLPVLDSLEKCQGHLKDKGLALVLSQLKKVLESEGLEEILVEKEVFDPETMDAIEMVKGQKNRVIEVVLKGYKLNGKALRPAKVKVGTGGKL